MILIISYRKLFSEYEKDLGLKPVWVSLDKAIKNNKKIMKSSYKKAPRWTKRDTYVLEEIKKHYKNDEDKINREKR